MDGPHLICFFLAFCGMLIVIGSLRLARIELGKAPDGRGIEARRDPRVFDAYRASTLFGGWMTFWSIVGLCDAYDYLGRFGGMLFSAGEIFIGLLYWVGLVGAYTVFLVYRRQEFYGRHPLQCEDQAQQEVAARGAP